MGAETAVRTVSAGALASPRKGNPGVLLKNAGMVAMVFSLPF
jgi:hypothetical protein